MHTAPSLPLPPPAEEHDPRAADDEARFAPLAGADRFLREAAELWAPFEGTYVFDSMMDGYRAKLGQDGSAYARWLHRMLAGLTARHELRGKRVLDFGCGCGELAVTMRRLGYDVSGVDANERQLRLARFLARENGMGSEMFVGAAAGPLRWDDGTFDVVTLFSVLEHLADDDLSALLPELRRVTRGVIFVLVPNRLKLRDDHTNLPLLPWMPRWMARGYARLARSAYRGVFAEDDPWDIHYRGHRRIRELARSHGFAMEYVPDEAVFPPLDEVPPLHRVGRTVRWRGRERFLGVPLPVRRAERLGLPRQAFHNYLNFTLRPDTTEAARPAR